MSAVATTQAEIRLQNMLEERDLVQRKHEGVLEVINARDDKIPNEVEQEHLTALREKATSLDEGIDTLSRDVESAQKAMEKSRSIRRAMAGNETGVTVDEDGIVYRDFYTYARDVVLTRDNIQGAAKLAKAFSSEAEMIAMRERMNLLQRTPANTLSSNVGGLQPPQYIDQIFQVINKSRALVDAAQRTTLERGVLTYPQVTQRPLVAVQNSEKSEAGNQSMVVGMDSVNATTYLGGGDLSWQALNWSTPDALQLWFDLAAADYALKTEEAAAKVVTDSAFGHIVDDDFAPSAPATDFAAFMTAVGEGYSGVFANSGRIANTLLIAPDFYGYLLGVTSTPTAVFANVGGQDVGPLNIVVSRGLDSGTAIVGDMSGLLVAETAGAPVELRVIEPAIGGLEVGIIGAFAPVVVDPGAFALITTAS